MKKKLLVIAAAFMLMFSFAGQVMAAFSPMDGDLIQVVYVNGGSGAEVATDLGSALSNFTTLNSVTTDTLLTNTVNFSSAFSGLSMSQLNVAYFIYDGTDDFWVSGPTTGTQTNAAGQMSSAASSFTAVLNYYKSLSGTLSSDGTSTQAIGLSSALNSFYKIMDGNGVNVGNFGGFIKSPLGSGVTSLAGLSTTGYVDQYLYYYDSSVANTSSNGIAIADIRTWSNGSTEIIPLVSTPLPAAVWLLGSGLVGLVGIRRRRETA
ncbi:MAG: VPLPA-CTERM sorting domain-containing protein [Smithella sp.]|jgi:hypothetical protein